MKDEPNPIEAAIAFLNLLDEVMLMLLPRLDQSNEMVQELSQIDWTNKEIQDDLQALLDGTNAELLTRVLKSFGGEHSTQMRIRSNVWTFDAVPGMNPIQPVLCSS